MTRSTSHADEQSAKRSSSVAANVVRRAEPAERCRALEARRAVEGGKRALEPPLPAVRRRERRRALCVLDPEPRDRTQALALARRRLEWPGEAGERTPPRRARDLALVEERAGVVPERARLARHPVVRRRLAREHEPAARAGACRVEEVAVAGDRVHALEATTKLAPRVVVEERGWSVSPRKAPFLEPEQDDDVEVARSGPGVVENGDIACLACGERSNGRALERRDDGVVPEWFAVTACERIEIVERPGGGLIRTGVSPGIVRRRRRVEAPGAARHRTDEIADGGRGVVGGSELVEGRQRRPAQALRLLRHTLRLCDRTAPKTALDEVHRAALEARERRAQVAEQVASAPARPREAQKAEQGTAERGLAQSRGLLDCERDSERREDGVERRAPAIDRVADDSDLLRRDPFSQERQHLRGDELGRAAHACALEEGERAVERRAWLGGVREELPLEVDERRRDTSLQPGGRGWELLDRTRRELGEIRHGPLERGERGTAGLVRDRDGDLGARGERLEQRPFGAGQILEAVREDRLARPRAEVGRDALGCSAAETVAIPEPDAIELIAVRRGEPREIAVESRGSHECRCELAERRDEGVGEAVRPGGSREPLERRAADRVPDRKRALNLRGNRPVRGIVADDVLEEVVERPDVAREQRPPAAQEVALDPLDVRTVRDDEPGIAPGVTLERDEIALEEQRNFAGVGRPHDERERHLSMVVPACDALSYAAGRLCAKSDKPGSGARDLTPTLPSRAYATADFGRRPRRATAWPGIFAEQLSQRSACFAPRRASLNVIRMTEPFPSSTSLEQLSQTRTVLRAISYFLLVFAHRNERRLENNAE